MVSRQFADLRIKLNEIDDRLTGLDGMDSYKVF